MTKVVYKFSIDVFIPLGKVLKLGAFEDLFNGTGYGAESKDSMAYTVSYDEPEGKGLTAEQNNAMRKIIQMGMDKILKDKKFNGYKLTVNKGVRQDEE